MRAHTLLFRWFMGTNVYGTGSIKTWKTRHIVSEDIWIFLQCIVGRTSKVAWSFSWMTSRTSLRVVGDCEWLALNLSHSLNKQLATTSAGKLRPPVPTAGMATVLSWRLCAASRTFLTKWRTTWTTMYICAASTDTTWPAYVVPIIYKTEF